MSFEEFFTALWGYAPYAWQSRLAAHVLETGAWPSEITAPTGTGKSAVIDIHLYAQAFGVHRMPRRLAMCVNRRAIVDQHEDRARYIAEALESASEGILAQVHQRLAALATTPGPAVRVISMRGGTSVNREWVNDVSAATVITTTPDMWASRVLFGGYGVSAGARAREAGLLGMDSVLVVDEAHLSTQLLTTARDVADLSRGGAAAIGVPGLSVVATSATLGTDGLGVRQSDLDSDPRLAALLSKPKPVAAVALDSWCKNKATARYVSDIADQATVLSHAVDGTVGVFVNRVDTAVMVSAALAKKHGNEAVKTWVGRMRPMDTPSLEDIMGDTAVRFVVATQTLEVGVDADFAGMISELAPAPSLIQRAGRVNRHGLRDEGPIVVLGPSSDDVPEALPYSGDDLTAAWQWIRRMDDLAGVRDYPAMTPRRPLLTPVRRLDADMLALTGADTDRPDLTLWIRDDISPEGAEVSIVMREGLSVDDSAAIEALTWTPVVPAECFPTTMSDARTLLDPAHGEVARFFVVGDDGILLGDIEHLDAGMTVVIDAAPLTWHGVITTAIHDRVTPQCLYPVVDAPGEHSGPFVVRDASRCPSEMPGYVIHPSQMESWAVYTPVAEVVSDDVERQVVSVRHSVSLDTHQHAVAEYTELLATRLGLREDVAGSCRDAALIHDEGKRDARFQRGVLGNNDESRFLAKSGPSSRQRPPTSLPRGWRHEQLSAAYAHARGYSDLAVRLAGTSHGHGRMMFPHAAAFLLADIEGDPFYDEDIQRSVRELFTTGAGWSDIMADTDSRYSVWGSAYLEAVVRCADCTVSKMGS